VRPLHIKKIPRSGLGEPGNWNLEDEVKRIIVTGPVGAGKSRLAQELGRVLGIRVVHIDELFWRPGWVATPPEEFGAVQRRERGANSWIVDGQFDDMDGGWFEAADTVVFIDASILRCLWRVSRRRLGGGSGVGTPSGPPGRAHRALVKFARNQWRYRRKVRAEILEELDGGRRVVVLRRPSDTAAFVRSVDSARAAGGTF
jgi:adenylate kinase family enzyme